MLKIIAPGLLALVLSGCAASVPYQPDTDLPRIAADLGLREPITVHHRCLAGIAAPREPSVTLVDCLYIGTQHSAMLVDYDPSTRTYKQALVVSKQATSVALANGPLLGLRQVHVQRPEGLLVLCTVNDRRVSLGQGPNTEAVYQHLVSVGLKSAAAAKFYIAEIRP